MTSALHSAIAGLNPQQRDAVTHTGGPLLILAGAGSGKTRVITVRIAWLIEEQGVDPREILAVTFTNKAAGEMRKRAAELVERASEVTIRTFHSFGAWLLRRNADRAGLPRGFTIYDDDDAVTLLHTIYPDQKRATLSRFQHLISRAKDYCLEPDDDLSEVSYADDFEQIYRDYQRRIAEIGNVDFGDLIMRPVQLLEGDRVVADRLRSRFRHVLVDEYQDSNVAQFRLLSSLCDERTNVCVVGDDDQSIYRFRGAEVQNILSFPETFAGTHVVRLEQNYRSTTPILDLAGAVVAKNVGRLGKNLFTERPGGDLPRLVPLESAEDEASFVVELARQARTSGDTRELAVLYRTNAQSRLFETALLHAGVNYRIVGSVRFYDREEVKDAVAFLRFLANPRDEVGFRRIVNKPARGLGPKAVATVMAALGDAGGDLHRACSLAIAGLSPRAGRSLKGFTDTVDDLRALLTGDSARLDELPDSLEAAPHTLAVIVARMLQLSGLAELHHGNDEVAGTQRLANLEELVNASSLYKPDSDGLIEFLEAIELDSARERETSDDARVTLITMHNTKGLEFDRVVISGLEDGLFPRGDSPEELEEERRLFYVAVTRARDDLMLTTCRSRRIHGRYTTMLPSRFLAEIPRELLSVDGAGGVGAGMAGIADSAHREDHPWPRGTSVYHDDYGSGVVTRAWYSGREPVVLVQFETGQTAQFLPAYTPLERIAQW